MKILTKINFHQLVQGVKMTNKIPRYNVYVSDMFLDTKQPKKHQERFIRKLLGDNAYYKRWRDKQQTKDKNEQ